MADAKPQKVCMDGCETFAEKATTEKKVINGDERDSGIP